MSLPESSFWSIFDNCISRYFTNVPANSKISSVKSSSPKLRSKILKQTETEIKDIDKQIEKEIKDGILPDPNAVIDPETGMPTGQKMDLGVPVTEPDLESQGSATEAPEGGEI